MQKVTVGDISLAYDERGSGNGVLMVHGIPTDYRVWNSQLENLSPFFHAVSISRRHAFPNKNESKITESTIQNNSADLIGLIQELKLQPVHLIGHSYGGFISLYTAKNQPELFRSLTLIEPSVPSILVQNEKNPFQVLAFLFSNYSAALSARRFQTGPLKRALQAYDNGDYPGAVKNFYDGIKETPNSFEKLPAFVHEMMSSNDITIGELETEFPIFSKSDAKKIRLPTLLIKGQNSPKWLQAIVDRLAKSIPNSTAVQISGSGHFSHIENPSELNSKILEFLKKNN
ncbi:MAG: alpha/beta hydrolase [Thaumarchaeota archaeon]|nr:alpha/beta hydrolase [Nitrososphaerota archaeon]